MPLDGPAGTGFAQGFTQTTIQLARLRMAQEAQNAALATQKERIKLEQQRIKGMEATTQLRNEAIRQQMQEALQRGRVATSIVAPEGPTQEAAATLTPERMLAAEAIRGGDIRTAASLLVPSPAKQPTTVAAAMLAQGIAPEEVLRTIEREKAQFRKGMRISQDADGNPVIEIGGGVTGLPPAEVTRLNRTVTQSRRLLRVVDRLRGLVTTNPESFGLAADLRLTVASALREGNRAFGTLFQFGGEIAQRMQPLDEAAQQLQQNISTGDISRGQFLTELLVAAIAVQRDPRGQISNREIAAARRQVGGVIRNIEDLLPRLEELETSLRSDFSDAASSLKRNNVFVPDLPTRQQRQQPQRSQPRPQQLRQDTPQQADIRRRLKTLGMTDEEINQAIGRQ